MAFTVEHVKSLLQRDLVIQLEKSIDKYSCQDKAGALFKSEQAL